MIPHISLLELLRGVKASTGAELNGGEAAHVTTLAPILGPSSPSPGFAGYFPTGGEVIGPTGGEVNAPHGWGMIGSLRGTVGRSGSPRSCRSPWRRLPSPTSRPGTEPGSGRWRSISSCSG